MEHKYISEICQGPTKKRVTSRPAKGKDVYLQGSRQMDSLTRQYYERNLGAGMFVSPETENGLVGYSEPLRRFHSSMKASPCRSTRSPTRCPHGSLAKIT